LVEQEPAHAHQVHITTLDIGQVSHEPHRHPEGELLIDLRNIRNVGSTPATYHVIQWRAAGAALGLATAQSALSALKDREINR
jgi:hypothetical protein